MSFVQIYFLISIGFALFLGINGKYVEGELQTSKDWEFLTRFCFLSAKGTLKFKFEYPISYGPTNVLLYFDTADQWDSVYDSDLSCSAREARLDITKNQIINLTTSFGLSGCQINNDMYECIGGRIFRSTRERWWFIAVSRCNPDPTDPVGLSLKYEIHMTNGKEGDFLHREYSADEFYIFPIDLVFLGMYILLCILTVICAIFLRNRQLWHTTYKMFMVSVFLWTFYLFLHATAYGIYGNDGLEWKLRATKYAARAFESISIMIFLLMLILVAKGYTITRGKLSMSSTVKISVFMTVYAVTYVVIFIWEAVMFDPGLVLYLYESPPGYCLIALRLIGYLWFCYAIFFTLKHYPEKGSFYYPLFVFYTLWFWASPIVIIVAMTAMAPWSREKTVVGVESFVAFCGHVFFLVLTRPSAANKNFPYHVRTTQIGIMQNAPHQSVEGTDSTGDGSFANHNYAVSSPMPSSSSGPDLTNLFTTSKTRSDEKETSLNGEAKHNGFIEPSPYGNPFVTSHTTSSAPRGRMNSSAHLMSEAEEYDMSEVNYPSLPMEASAPPSYAALFQANGTNRGSSNNEKANPP